MYFTSKEIEQLSGVTPQDLSYWRRTHKLIKPSLRQPSGSGTVAVYAIKDLLRAAEIKALRDFGLTFDAIKRHDGFKETVTK